MKTWIGTFSVASALFLAFACGDDDPKNGGNSGGAGGDAGNAGETGGSTHTGGVDSGGGGAGGDAGGAGGVPGVTCEPPTPPTGSSGSDNAGGAGGAAGAAGSGGEAGGAVTSELAIEGSYIDDFMGQHIVTGSTWTSSGSVYHFASYDNAAHFIIARNDQGNMYNPCLWSRFDWTVSGGQLYYCMTAYAAESEEAARATPAADPTDPGTTGCGPFSWSMLTPE